MAEKMIDLNTETNGWYFETNGRLVNTTGDSLFYDKDKKLLVVNPLHKENKTKREERAERFYPVHLIKGYYQATETQEVARLKAKNKQKPLALIDVVYQDIVVGRATKKRLRSYPGSDDTHVVTTIVPNEEFFKTELATEQEKITKEVIIPFAYKWTAKLNELNEETFVSSLFPTATFDEWRDWSKSQDVKPIITDNSVVSEVSDNDEPNSDESSLVEMVDSDDDDIVVELSEDSEEIDVLVASDNSSFVLHEDEEEIIVLTPPGNYEAVYASRKDEFSQESLAAERELDIEEELQEFVASTDNISTKDARGDLIRSFYSGAHCDTQGDYASLNADADSPLVTPSGLDPIDHWEDVDLDSTTSLVIKATEDYLDDELIVEIDDIEETPFPTRHPWRIRTRGEKTGGIGEKSPFSFPRDEKKVADDEVSFTALEQAETIVNNMKQLAFLLEYFNLDLHLSQKDLDSALIDKLNQRLDIVVHPIDRNCATDISVSENDCLSLL